jgi:hypothetical protein
MIPEKGAANDSGPGVCQSRATMVWRLAVSQASACLVSAMLYKKDNRLIGLSATMRAETMSGCVDDGAAMVRK